jgi:hypothetical protein
MRFISMHKATKDMEAGAPPPPAVMAGMGPLMEEMMKTGIFLAGEGLRPSAHGVRLTFSGGKRTVTAGPLTGSNELTDRYLIVRVRSIDDAIEWATRFAGADDAEIDVRPVTEPWDLGFMPKPPELTTTRFMILRKANAHSEAGAADFTAFTSLSIDMERAGVLVSREALQPSATGVRLRFRGGDCRAIDGPFTESKELIAGFSIMQAVSREECIQWATRFAELIGDIEIDIRPLYEVP